MTFDAGPAGAGEIEEAVEVLRAGGLVAFPTETVYGLGADAANPAAVGRIFAVKGRPPTHPVIVHLGATSQLEQWAASVTPSAVALAEAFWPGPLTLVMSKAPGVADEVTGGRATVGLRVPAHPLALALLRAFGGGLAAPSANRFGRVSPTTAADVRADLGDDVAIVLDGGPSAVGVESTIVDLSDEAVTVLRLGAITVEMLSATLGRPVEDGVGGEARAPGMLAAHYAPRARVEVCSAEAVASRAAQLVDDGLRVGVLGFTSVQSLDAHVHVLDAGTDAAAYARVVYARLRQADDLGLDTLLAVPPPTAGIGAAVADRLRRAAATTR